jgi:hypothetical protein
MRDFYPYQYTNRSTKMAAHDNRTAWQHTKTAWPTLVEECREWAKVSDPTLQFKVKDVDDTHWPDSNVAWEDTWVSEATANQARRAEEDEAHSDSESDLF